jgi:hypothetical protein
VSLSQKDVNGVLGSRGQQADVIAGENHTNSLYLDIEVEPEFNDSAEVG